MFQGFIRVQHIQAADCDAADEPLSSRYLNLHSYTWLRTGKVKLSLRLIKHDDFKVCEGVGV